MMCREENEVVLSRTVSVARRVEEPAHWGRGRALLNFRIRRAYGVAERSEPI